LNFIAKQIQKNCQKNSALQKKWKKTNKKNTKLLALGLCRKKAIKPWEL